MLLAVMALAAAQPPLKPDSPAVENAVRQALRDPDSAKLAWPYQFVRETRDMANGHHFEGWMTCGTVNAKNGYGGYSGPVAAMVLVEDDGTVYPALIDRPQQVFVGSICAKKGQPVN